jgi:YD repeat-containing protein
LYEPIATTSNQLNSTTGSITRTYGYDTAGNLMSFNGEAFFFGQRGRMTSATSNAGKTNYFYNALGQLIEKSENGGTTLLMYDEAGHLLGEYQGSGALVQETIWMGDTPVATLRPSGSTVAVYYVHTDHLGTPRKITRPSDNGLMWRWDPDTYGSTAQNWNPAGLVSTHYRESWYLDAWDEGKQALRCFAIDRILRATLLSQKAVDVSESALDAHYASSYGIFGGQADKVAVLRFNRERARWVADELWHPEQLGKHLEDGSYELRIPYRDQRELVMDILRHGPHVLVIEPQSLVDEVKSQLTGALGRYNQA